MKRHNAHYTIWVTSAALGGKRRCAMIRDRYDIENLALGMCWIGVYGIYAERHRWQQCYCCGTPLIIWLLSNSSPPPLPCSFLLSDKLYFPSYTINISKNKDVSRIKSTKVSYLVCSALSKHWAARLLIRWVMNSPGFFFYSFLLRWCFLAGLVLRMRVRRRWWGLLCDAVNDIEECGVD